jgi:hypothetical protein
MSPEKRGEGFVLEGPAGPSSAITFDTFVLGLASTAMIHLGIAPHPETGKTTRDLPLARQSLDLLALLRQKTKGNLTPNEEQLFDRLLGDLQLQYVEASKR